jgi:hypothetical protein
MISPDALISLKAGANPSRRIPRSPATYRDCATILVRQVYLCRVKYIYAFLNHSRVLSMGVGDNRGGGMSFPTCTYPSGDFQWVRSFALSLYLQQALRR